jgi:hypothetical protein
VHVGLLLLPLRGPNAAVSPSPLPRCCCHCCWWCNLVHVSKKPVLVVFIILFIHRDTEVPCVKKGVKKGVKSSMKLRWMARMSRA